MTPELKALVRVYRLHMASFDTKIAFLVPAIERMATDIHQIRAQLDRLANDSAEVQIA